MHEKLCILMCFHFNNNARLNHVNCFLGYENLKLKTHENLKKTEPINIPLLQQQ